MPETSNYKSRSGGEPFEVWRNEDGSGPLPEAFGFAEDVADNGKVTIRRRDGSRVTLGKDDVAYMEHGVLRTSRKRLFEARFEQTSEQPAESLREQFERQRGEDEAGDPRFAERAHPGEVKSGSEGKPRQGAVTVVTRPETEDSLDPSGTVPGAPLGADPGAPNTGGSPHEKASPAAQPELVERGTDAKVEAPSRPAADSVRSEAAKPEPAKPEPEKQPTAQQAAKSPSRR